MALILADRVKQESTTTGTGTIAFSGGVDGFQAFSAVCSTNDTLYYVIQDKIGTNFEIGHGTFNGSGQLERTNILQSSNSDNAVNFGAGTKDVFITYPADKAVFQNYDGSITIPSTIDGRDLQTDGTKLDGIEASATADQTASEIRTLVESASDSNVFTDADHTKLNGIETSATADQTKSDIDALNINADTLDGQHGSYYTGYTDTAVSNLVDSSPAALNTLNELAAALGDDANFSTTVNNNIATKLPLAGGTMTGQISLGDNVKTNFGASNDLQIYHDGSNSKIETDSGSVGDLYIASQRSGSDLYLRAENDIKIQPQGGENGILVQGDGGVVIYNDNGFKFETDGQGANISGVLDVSSKMNVAGGTDATSSDGAIRTAGGVSAAKKMYVGTDLTVANNIAVTGTVDGRDIATDGTKLDGIEASADVNVKANWTESSSSSDAFIQNKPSLSTVATSGSYNDLSNKPTIPTNNNQLTNGSGYITSSSVPTNNNQLTNGAGYVTSDTNTTYSAGTGMSLSGTTFNCTIDSPSEVGLGNLSSSGNSLSGSFTASGNITAYSSRKLKSDIKTIDNALDKVSQMRGVTFTKDGELSSGVIAEEFEKIAPELVQDGEYKSVAYGNTVGYLIEAIKQLKERNEKLELIVNKLITDVEEMEVCSCP